MVNAYQAIKAADKEERMIELQLEQAKGEFRLEIQYITEYKRLREIED